MIYESVTAMIEAIEAEATKHGFQYSTSSNISEAIYMSYPGREGHLRIAAHPCRHPFGVYGNLVINPSRYEKFDEEWCEEVYDFDFWQVEDSLVAAINNFLENAPEEEDEE